MKQQMNIEAYDSDGNKVLVTVEVDYPTSPPVPEMGDRFDRSKLLPHELAIDWDKETFFIEQRLQGVPEIDEPEAALRDWLEGEIWDRDQRSDLVTARFFGSRPSVLDVRLWAACLNDYCGMVGLPYVFTGQHPSENVPEALDEVLLLARWMRAHPSQLPTG